ncbi:MAG: ABC transporter permease [Anaerolineae bacterium]|nr:ABC transporter permease [Anaerolineae bacterium]
MSNQIQKKEKIIREKPENLRQVIMGALFLLIALFIGFVFIRTTDTLMTTTFVMTPGGSKATLPDLVFNTRAALIAISALCAILGVYQLIKGFGKATNWILGFVGILLTTSFLAWGAGGGSINVGGMLRVAIMRSVPIVLGAFSGILCERVGVTNIAIEGMMITGALVGSMFGSLFGLWTGVIAAIISGGLTGSIHAMLSIKYKVNQIISGTIINIFTVGLTSYIVTKILQVAEWQYLNQSGFFPSYSIPLLSKIPFLGPIFFSHNMFVYAMYLLVGILTFALFHTRWGLRLRAVGEHPKAADTLGINVFRTRYLVVILGGMMAGFAGSYFSLGSLGYFEQVMSAGRGFIGLAAMIFGKWTPVGSLGAGLLFGFAESLSTNLSILRFPIPAELLLMVPYILTMVILAGVVGRSQGPAATGVPYEKESL